MSAIVTMEEAQAKLPELVARLGSGEELVITQDQKPVAKLTRELPPARKPRKAGNCIGMIEIVADDQRSPLFRRNLDAANGCRIWLPCHAQIKASNPALVKANFHRVIEKGAGVQYMVLGASSVIGFYGRSRI